MPLEDKRADGRDKFVPFHLTSDETGSASDANRVESNGGRLDQIGGYDGTRRDQ